MLKKSRRKTLSQAEIVDFIQNMDHGAQIEKDSSKKLIQKMEPAPMAEASGINLDWPAGLFEDTETPQLEEVQLIRDFCKVSMKYFFLIYFLHYF